MVAKIITLIFFMLLLLILLFLFFMNPVYYLTKGLLNLITLSIIFCLYFLVINKYIENNFFNILLKEKSLLVRTMMFIILPFGLDMWWLCVIKILIIVGTEMFYGDKITFIFIFKTSILIILYVFFPFLVCYLSIEYLYVIYTDNSHITCIYPGRNSHDSGNLEAIDRLNQKGFTLHWNKLVVKDPHNTSELFLKNGGSAQPFAKNFAKALWENDLIMFNDPRPHDVVYVPGTDLLPYIQEKDKPFFWAACERSYESLVAAGSNYRLPPREDMYRNSAEVREYLRNMP